MEIVGLSEVVRVHPVLYFLESRDEETDGYLDDKNDPKRRYRFNSKGCPKMQTHKPETSDFGLLVAFSTSRRRSVCSASPLVLDMPASSPLRPCSCSLLFLSLLRFSFSAATRFPSSASLRFLFFRFSRSKPSAFLRARSSSSSLTTHGVLSTSFRKAVFSAQSSASSFVVRMMAVKTRYGVSPWRGSGACLQTYIFAPTASASSP